MSQLLNIVAPSSSPALVLKDPSEDTTLMMNKYSSYVRTLLSEESKDNTKYLALQEISDNFDAIIQSPQYPEFLDLCLNVFVKVLTEGRPHFTSEDHVQKSRKLMLDLINRFPCNEHYKAHIETIIKLCVELIDKENEENTIVIIRIFFDLHKHFRPPQHVEVTKIIHFSKRLYLNLGDQVPKIFEVSAKSRKYKDFMDIPLENIINEIYTTTQVNYDVRGPDGKVITKNIKILPKGYQSLKVMQELPLTIVLFYQLYKENVKKELDEFIPIILKTINLKPPVKFVTALDAYRDIYIDFLCTQIKTISFIAYIVRFYQDVLNKHSNLLVDGVLNLLALCPTEVTNLKRELLFAARHILQTDFKIKFLPHMNCLFDEDIMIGPGWTTYESIRPIVYTTLADLVHHVRQLLPMSDLAKSVHLFSKVVHDETLSTSIQTICCKLLLNLVDFIRAKNQAEIDQGRIGENTGKELLERLLETMVLKFKTIAKLQLPILIAKAKAQQLAQSGVSITEVPTTSDDVKAGTSSQTGGIPESPSKFGDKGSEKPKPKISTIPSPAANYNINDCRSMVKILVCGVKTITMALAASKINPGVDGAPATPSFGNFIPKDTKIYIRFVKWALKAFDVYTLNPQTSPYLLTNIAAMQRQSVGGIQQQRTANSKDEKEVLEHFSGVFSLMNPQTFREIFASTIDYMVERMSHNISLQVVSNSFLVARDTSPVFATVLVEYLLEHMEEMGNGNIERSNLCLKLFKLVFGSVSFYPVENEHMLRPHLHKIVNRSMELAMTAKEPYNYFLLLRALFRSIGGGSHDLLYQEFLPLLKNLLEGLNSLQSGLHKQQMKDLFVELCLTVPVRLSSLLPFLPMLMDPLVSALNGSPTLISQGLRTLELCVDNLQPEFLYDHIQPVRADLMQALWRSLRSPNEQVAHVAYRVLGKFGGGNRKMMIEPQKLEYNIRKSNGPAVLVHFPDHQKTINLSVEKAIETAVNVLKTTTYDMFYRKQGWKVIKSYIISSMNLTDDRSTIQKLFSHPSFVKNENNQESIYKYSDVTIRNTHQTALTGIFIAYLIKDLRKDSIHHTILIVRHYTLVAITQQAGPFPLHGKTDLLEGTMDPMVLIDAIAVVLGHEDKELCKPGHIALRCIIDTAICITGSIEKASNLPLMEYLAERVCNLCYERAWYSKLGGCYAIKFFYKSMSIKWIYNHLFVFVKALLFVMMDLTGEVSSGAIDEAKNDLKELIILCAAPIKEHVDTETLLVQTKALSEVTNELTRNITLPNDLLREQSMYLLRVFAETQGKSIVQVMEPHKDVLADIIPPKKLLIRNHAANAQIGLMEGNTFCQSLTPRLFTTDLNITEHLQFFQEITNICESSDQVLMKFPCYKSINSLVPLRKAAMRALASWHYVPGCSQKIFNTLYTALERSNPELQEAAFQAMKTFVNGSPIDLKTVYEVMKPLLLTLGDYRNFTLSGVRKLSYIVQPFPSSFSEKLCEQLLVNLKNLFENIVAQKDSSNKNTDTEKIIVVIIGIFKESPAAKAQFIDPLIGLILENEHALSIGPYSPYREPLVKYLLRYPKETLQSILSEAHMKNPLWRNFLVYLIKHPDGKCFRDTLQNDFVERLKMLMITALNPSCAHLPTSERLEMQYIGIRLVSILIKLDTQWIASQNQIIRHCQKIWVDEDYLERHRKTENINYVHWKEPKLIVKILLQYFRQHNNVTDILFIVIRAVTYRLLPDFTFLRDFIEITVAQTYSVEWKRNAFIKYLEVYKSQTVSQDLKAKIMKLLLIPCFTVCFERGEGDELIAGTGEAKENIVALFITNIIEPSNHQNTSEPVRILILQMSCLLVEHASHYIYDATQGKPNHNTVKALMLFAWPSLVNKHCYDAATRFHGHLLLAYMTTKFSVSQRVIAQVFMNLLKAHASDVRSIVRQALEVLTPALANRIENGPNLLLSWTKRVLIDEGHSNPNLFHILNLIAKHFKLYYPVRHGLIQTMIGSMQRLGFTSSTMEHKKLSVELADTIIKWELQRVKDEDASSNAVKTEEPPRKKIAGMPQGGGTEPTPVVRDMSTAIINLSSKPIEKTHSDAVINFLARLSCQVCDMPQNQAVSTLHNQLIQSPGENLARRCVSLIRMALKPEVWSHKNIDFKLTFMEKLLLTVEQPNCNLGNVSIALELLTLLITILDEKEILNIIKTIQRGIIACISSPISKIIRLVHALLCRLMTTFPTEPMSSNVASKKEELDQIYVCVSKVIYEGLSNYEKNTNATSSSLYGTVMMLKAACINHSAYVDRFLLEFMRVIQRMAREHITLTTAENPQQVGSELLIYCIDLVKNRFSNMNQDIRKQFIGTIILGLIDKTPDIKVMRAILKMTEDWLKVSKNDQNNVPNLKEKCFILVKLMLHVEKRFPDLNNQFLELVLYVYMDETLKNSELIIKLEPAFLNGLRCTNPILRSKFFQLFNGSIRRLLYDRLFYIFSSQNWEPMGSHYWLNQCIELILVSAISSSKLKLAEDTGVLPSISSVISLAEDPVEKEKYFNVVVTNSSGIKVEQMNTSDGQINNSDNSEEVEIDDNLEPNNFYNIKLEGLSKEELLNRQCKFLEKSREYNTSDLLISLSQLCHLDINLSEKIWLDMFPQLWSILSENQQQNLTDEIIPFIVSGIHVIQKDVHPSSINTIYEALSFCNPQLPIKPAIMTYLGKSQSLWHRVTLSLEKMAIDHTLKQKGLPSIIDCYDFEPENIPQQQDIIDQLAEMYSDLKEEDMWHGLWQKNAKYKETLFALSYEQQGFFQQAQKAYEVAINKSIEEYSNKSAPSSHNSELRLWEKQWVRCCKELNQWDTLLKYGKTNSSMNPFLILESAWKVPDWKLMKEALNQVEPNCPKELLWKVHLYRGYLAICNPEDPQQQIQHLSPVERFVELASQSCMNLWKSYPHVVSHIHLPLLQAAQQIMELQEAVQIHQSLLHGRNTPNSLHDMKATVKTWRNRLPVIADDLSHWSDVFNWRQHHYQFITQHYDALNAMKDQGGGPNTGNRSILGVHSSAQAIIQFGKIARKHHLTSVCLDSLFRLYTIPSVPIVDCFEKIRQQVKCYLQMAAVDGNNQLQEGLEVIEHTNLKYLTEEMTAEFYAFKGMLLAKTGRSNEANKAFSAATQMHDVLVKAWALWGDYMEQRFTSSSPPNMPLGVFAITCFLHACRHQNESKSRKYLAKVLWLLTYDVQKTQEQQDKHISAPLMDALDKYSAGMPPIQWLPWIPQLLTCLAMNNGASILSLLTQVSKVYPQAVFLPIRTMYFTLKIEQRERYKIAEQSGKPIISPPDAPGIGIIQHQQQSSQNSQEAPKLSTSSETTPIRATPSMWRCSRIMHTQREMHPPVLISLEGIVDQMVWFRESWYEEVLRQVKLGLTKCYRIAFETKDNVKDANVSAHTLQFVKKLITTFGIGIENVNSMTATFTSAGSESLARRAQQTIQDPVFQRMKSQFTADFDFKVPGATKLHNLIPKMKKWIKILEAKNRALPKSCLIEERCRYLSNFNLHTAEIELPGEYLLPKHSHYYVRISRFMPRVDIVEKHNTAARRLYIRGHNGKIYPYLVMNDSGLSDSRRDERVLQLLRMLNYFLTKQKETSKRFLHFTVPRVVPVSAQLRLVEDNPTSLSLLDIYKSSCNQIKIDYELPIVKYYDRLKTLQSRGSVATPQVMYDILKENQTQLIPRTMLKHWALHTFISATDYWTFRKMLTLQLALACFAEYVFHLTRLNPDMMYVHQDSGLLNVSYFKFDIDETKGELNSNRPVPFRLTPNIMEFLTDIGVDGPLTASIIATARCLVQPNFRVQAILKAILRDEIIAIQKKKQDEEYEVMYADPPDVPGEITISMVTRAVAAISSRLNSLAQTEGPESQVSALVKAAKNTENLCMMDPSWHPWL